MATWEGEILCPAGMISAIFIPYIKSAEGIALKLGVIDSSGEPKSSPLLCCFHLFLFGKACGFKGADEMPDIIRHSRNHFKTPFRIGS